MMSCQQGGTTLWKKFHSKMAICARQRCKCEINPKVVWRNKRTAPYANIFFISEWTPSTFDSPCYPSALSHPGNSVEAEPGTFRSNNPPDLPGPGKFWVWLKPHPVLLRPRLRGKDQSLRFRRVMQAFLDLWVQAGLPENELSLLWKKNGQSLVGVTRKNFDQDKK